MPTALITGITGQDGSYLAELLISKGYQVHGIVRRSSLFNTGRIDHILTDPHDSDARVRLHFGDLGDATGLRRILSETRPDEIYNLGAQSHVRVSFDQPEFTGDVVALGTLRMLEAVRGYVRSGEGDPRFYQAGSSEMFGNAPAPQSESSRFLPRSPYAIGKVAAHHYCQNYREAYGLFAVNGILFNHESPRRGETFVTRKITRALTRIKLGLQEKLYLGNLDASRDWGYAGDYVEAMWRMVQHSEPDDFVIATGQSNSVREFLDAAASYVGLDWREYVEFDPRYLRPSEVDVLEGDATKAADVLGWKPETSFDELVALMCDADLRLARREEALVAAGLHESHTGG